MIGFIEAVVSLFFGWLVFQSVINWSNSLSDRVEEIHEKVIKEETVINKADKSENHVNETSPQKEETVINKADKSKNHVNETSPQKVKINVDIVNKKYSDILNKSIEVYEEALQYSLGCGNTPQCASEDAKDARDNFLYENGINT